MKYVADPNYLGSISDIKDNSIDFVYVDGPFTVQTIIREEDKIDGTRTFIHDKCHDEYNEFDIDEVETPYQTLNTSLSYLKHFCFNSAYLEYLSFIGIKLTEAHRVLKETGSLFIHSSHYLMPYIKLLCDDIFTIDNHKNEVIWHYSILDVDFPKHALHYKYDTFLHYIKSDEADVFAPAKKLESILRNSSLSNFRIY